MNAKKAKLLRKIAKLSGRTDNYIKRQYKQMTPTQQEAYVLFIKENIRRIEEMAKNPTTPTITDVPKETLQEQTIGGGGKGEA